MSIIQNLHMANSNLREFFRYTATYITGSYDSKTNVVEYLVFTCDGIQIACNRALIGWRDKPLSGQSREQLFYIFKFVFFNYFLFLEIA